jgi:hypothetical protein
MFVVTLTELWFGWAAALGLRGVLGICLALLAYMGGKTGTVRGRRSLMVLDNRAVEVGKGRDKGGVLGGAGATREVRWTIGQLAVAVWLVSGLVTPDLGGFVAVLLLASFVGMVCLIGRRVGRSMVVLQLVGDDEGAEMEEPEHRDPWDPR